MASSPLDPLPPDLQQFVQDQLAQGKYQSAADVVCDAVRSLREREERVAALRDDIDQGIAQLDQGEHINIESDSDIHAFFADIHARGQQRLQTGRGE